MENGTRMKAKKAILLVEDDHSFRMSLKKLLERNPYRYKQFQFSILRVLEPSTMKEEVIGHEVLSKKKLGSRAFGLNSN